MRQKRTKTFIAIQKYEVMSDDVSKAYITDADNQTIGTLVWTLGNISVISILFLECGISKESNKDTCNK